MNEAETRTELIDPQLHASGWGVLEGSKILPELLTLKYMALDDAQKIPSTVETIRNIFIGFQKYLYEPKTANLSAS